MAVMAAGQLEKMPVSLGPDGVVRYDLVLGEARLDVSSLVGRRVSIRYLGQIMCQGCGSSTRKSFSQGYCYRCATTLARCDFCVLQPTRCHYERGTCREPEWAAGYCLIPHHVYLSNTSGLKVGLTRGHQALTRWIDQGAIQAVALWTAPSRRIAGLVEEAITSTIRDSTDWRGMLRGQTAPRDLMADVPLARSALQSSGLDLTALGVTAVQSPVVQPIAYPVKRYPAKLHSLNLEKEPVIEATLDGIKAQYLIFDCGVLNVRKFGGYSIQWETFD